MEPVVRNFECWTIIGVNNTTPIDMGVVALLVPRIRNCIPTAMAEEVTGATEEEEAAEEVQDDICHHHRRLVVALTIHV